MPMLSCSAVTCVYNKDELCSKGDIKVGGCDAKVPSQTCCESFEEKKESGMTNSMGMGNSRGYDTIDIYCEAEHCKSNDARKCIAGSIDIAGTDACRCEETKCASFVDKH